MILVLIYQLSTYQTLTYNDQEYPVSYQGIKFAIKKKLKLIYQTLVVGWILTFIGLIQIPLWIGVNIYRQSGSTILEVNVGQYYTSNCFLLLKIFLQTEMPNVI